MSPSRPWITGRLSPDRIGIKKLLKPEAKRLAASHVVSSLGLSKRKACLLVNLSRTAYSYQSRREDDTKLHNRLRALACERKRFGSPRLHIMLKRENLVVNHKRTERIYREEGLVTFPPKTGPTGIRENLVN